MTTSTKTGQQCFVSPFTVALLTREKLQKFMANLKVYPIKLSALEQKILMNLTNKVLSCIDMAALHGQLDLKHIALILISLAIYSLWTMQVL